MELLLFYLALALLVSFLCSILEAVFLSVSPSYVALLEQDGTAAGRRLSALKTDVDRPLSALLTLNTVAHTIGAAGVGAQAQIVFGEAYVTAASVILTLLILVLSEIIPKTLGARHWRRLAPLAANVLSLLILALYPLVLLAQGLTRLMAPEQGANEVTREEFQALAERGSREGALGDEEARILLSLLAASALRVSQILTPRTVVVSLPESATVAEAYARVRDRPFSRLPLYRGEDSEKIVGYVLYSEILGAVAEDKHDLPLAELRREVLVVPETVTVHGLLQHLLQRHEHLAVVVDEYGGLCGVVTSEDVFETILGVEIVDEADRVTDLRELAMRRGRRHLSRLGYGRY